MAGRTNRGMTLIELLVVIAMIALAAAILMPVLYIQRGRARLAHCRYNLKQLGLAMHSYHDTYKLFPPGIVSASVGGDVNCQFIALSDVCDNPDYSQVSALTLILPFMDDRAQYQAYNLSLACCSAANSTSTQAVVKTFLCPSNPRGNSLIQIGYYQGGKAAPTDYVLSMGGNSFLSCDSPHGWRCGYDPYPGQLRQGAGMFNVNSNVATRMIRDGMSHTIMMGEGAGGPRIAAGKTPVLPETVPTEEITGSSVDQPWSQGYIGNNGMGGFGSVFAATAHDAWYTIHLNLATQNASGWVPLKMNMTKLRLMRVTSYPAFNGTISFSGTTNSDPAPGSLIPGSVSPFRSYHKGMCHFLFADGSVRSVDEDVDPAVYVAMSTVSGKEDEWTFAPNAPRPKWP